MCYLCLLAEQHSAFKWKHTIFGCFPCSAEALVRWGGKIWENKVSFDRLLSSPYSCQKLSKLVDTRWTYSKLKQCRFLDSLLSLLSNCLTNLYHSFVIEIHYHLFTKIKLGQRTRNTCICYKKLSYWRRAVSVEILSTADSNSKSDLQDHPRSLVSVPFDTPHSISY